MAGIAAPDHARLVYDSPRAIRGRRTSAVSGRTTDLEGVRLELALGSPRTNGFSTIETPHAMERDRACH
jgi:hypothetical protein